MTVGGIASWDETGYRSHVMNSRETVRVLGIDPGVRAVGYGVIDAQGRDSRLVASGTIETDSNDSFPQRLLTIHRGIEEIIAKYKPQRMACEKLVYHRNVSIALAMSQARGAAIVAGAQADLPMDEFSPTEIKNAVVGKGRASKNQVQKMVQLLLGLPEPPESEHAADALAAALTYVHSRIMKEIRLRGRQ
jgi:crossover junction endodeoxyribonuclease RuvC